MLEIWTPSFAGETALTIKAPEALIALRAFRVGLRRLDRMSLNLHSKRFAHHAQDCGEVVHCRVGGLGQHAIAPVCRLCAAGRIALRS